jgi:hypothetical protein
MRRASQSLQMVLAFLLVGLCWGLQERAWRVLFWPLDGTLPFEVRQAVFYWSWSFNSLHALVQGPNI